MSGMPTPYVSSVSLQDGSQINIQGVPEHHQTQFVIALQSGSNINQRSEIPFWFNPRFNENQVVRNTLSGSSWGPEERPGLFPFQQGQMYDIRIVVRHDKYEFYILTKKTQHLGYDGPAALDIPYFGLVTSFHKVESFAWVSVNGRHFAEYRHRTLISAVNNLVVEGGTRINRICFEGPSLPVPYVGSVSLQDGNQINIQGVPEHHQTQFVIALQSGSNINQRSEIPFWFNPRFNENQVVRNTLSGSSWGPEERPGLFPFQQGQMYDIRIVVRHDKFEFYILMKKTQHLGYDGPAALDIPYFGLVTSFHKVESFAWVSVNGRHFAEYRHRTPISAVNNLVVEGGTRINRICFEGPSQYPGAVGGYPPPPSPMMFPVAPIYNPPTPFVQNIPGGIYPNKMIFISGIPSSNPTRFSIYLQNGMSYEPGHIGLVVDARFSFNSDRNVLVRNHQEHGNWGAEERAVSYFPFIPNTPFDMIILVEGHQFKVAVNNQHLLEFRHRLQPLSSIDTLRIDGSVALTQIRFQ